MPALCHRGETPSFLCLTTLDVQCLKCYLQEVMVETMVCESWFGEPARARRPVICTCTSLKRYLGPTRRPCFILKQLHVGAWPLCCACQQMDEGEAASSSSSSDDEDAAGQKAGPSGQGKDHLCMVRLRQLTVINNDE